MPTSSKLTYDLPTGAPPLVVEEEHIEYGFNGKLQNLKYEYRDVRKTGRAFFPFESG